MTRRRLAALVFAVVLVAVSGFLIWALAVPGPMPTAVEDLNSDSQVKVTQNQWLVFEPVQQTHSTGLIFYPGGRVVAEAYAPAMHAIAAVGYVSVIVPMPLHLAVLNIEGAQPVVEAYPNLTHWVVGGHSLGGSMAARFAAGHLDEIDGLLLWASYSDVDLSSSHLSVASMYGSQDGVLNMEQMQNSMHLLPDDTVVTVIEGGNHAQFGWYGPQNGDQEATISRDEQQAQAVTATLDLLARVEAQS